MKNAGFTLVELLVGLVLVGLLTVLLFGGFRFGLRAWEVSEVRLDHSARLGAVQNFLVREIGQAHGATVRQAGVEPAAEPSEVTFVGTRDSLAFVAPLPAHRGIGGLHGFRLFLRPDEQGSQLVADWRLYRAGGDPFYVGEDNAARSRTLLENIDKIELAYWGRQDPNLDPNWFDDWPGDLGVPLLIRIRVAFAEDDRRHWPTLYIATRLIVSER